ncbi:hypothetical protein CLF_107520 [Clonorchis sinensis]|uniref:Uncharacterized protein n=1 Tax=Clonorchis sinensis TaxID=79923 RepID=G7YQP9_CLOSI|nr:hypothetical protein CLF_107520 [Clonorchis sinensis]
MNQLDPVVTRLFVSLILHRFIKAEPEKSKQCSGLEGRATSSHFTRCQQQHSCKRPTILVFLGFKGAFDLTD